MTIADPGYDGSPRRMTDQPLRILILADHASIDFGGEAALPVHDFRVLMEQGHDVRMVVHERSRPFLSKAFPETIDRITFTPDRESHRRLMQLGAALHLPGRIRNSTTMFLRRYLTQRDLVREARRLIAEGPVDVVHQPIPVSPREPSAVYGLGVPVVIGPMNGAMQYPQAFRGHDHPLFAAALWGARAVSTVTHWLIPGKRRAAVLLSANPRTTAALPTKPRQRVIELVENGADLAKWDSPDSHAGSEAIEPRADPETIPPPADTLGAPRFVFLGRMDHWKRIDILIDAAARANRVTPIAVDIVGRGGQQEELEQQVERLGMQQQIVFHGWQPQTRCAQLLRGGRALALPSVFECGGAVVLEAMAARRAVIATAWGGPKDYLTDACGILIEPSSHEALVQGFTDAMVELAQNPERAEALGEAGRQRVEARYDWDRKGEQMVAIYREAISAYRGQ